jgi:hypothetical protein
VRSYDLALDAFRASKESGESIKAELKLIAKNTALPEFVKIKKSEAWKEQLRNRFIGEMNAGLFGSRAGMVRDFFDRISREVQTRAGQAANAFGQGAFAMDQMADAQASAKDFGVDGPGKEEIGGEVAGSLLSQGAMKRAGQPKIHPAKRQIGTHGIRLTGRLRILGRGCIGSFIRCR